MQLCDTEYNFSSEEEQEAASEFIAQLHLLDASLKVSSKFDLKLRR